MTFHSLEFPTDIVLLAVLWRLREKLSLRDAAERFLERGFAFTPEALRDGEERCAPLIADHLRTKRRAQAGRSWDVDETDLKGGGKWCSLVELFLNLSRLSLRTHEKLIYEVLFMRRRNVLIIGSLAALCLVIALGGIFFWVHIVPHDTHWTLTSLQVNGQTHELVPNDPVTLTVHETSQTITGSSGCNSYQATYQQHDSQIHFQDFGQTLVGCLGPVGAQEYLYIQALEQTETLVVSAHTMTLTGAGGKDILRFSSS